MGQEAPTRPGATAVPPHGCWPRCLSCPLRPEPTGKGQGSGAPSTPRPWEPPEAMGEKAMGLWTPGPLWVGAGSPRARGGLPGARLPLQIGEQGAVGAELHGGVGVRGGEQAAEGWADAWRGTSQALG